MPGPDGDVWKKANFTVHCSQGPYCLNSSLLIITSPDIIYGMIATQLTCALDPLIPIRQQRCPPLPSGL
jgi:hypothetical protein